VNTDIMLSRQGQMALRRQQSELNLRGERRYGDLEQDAEMALFQVHALRHLTGASIRAVGDISRENHPYADDPVAFRWALGLGTSGAVAMGDVIERFGRARY
jgi:hypothetical protein